MNVTITSKISETVNFASIHSGTALIDEIKISGEGIKKAILKITSVPAFLFEYKEEVTLNNGSIMFKEPAVLLDDTFYRTELIEAREGEIRIEILDPEDQSVVLGFDNTAVHVQPYLHWDAYYHADTIAAFLQPNDPLVANVVKKAGEYAARLGSSMHGYQGTQKEVKIQAECIYKALQDESLHYVSSPPSFEEAGQKIRIPHHVLHDEAKQGTCLDLAILYATCLESVSLNPVIVVISGHAFAGVWKKNVGLLSRYCSKADITGDVKQFIDENLIPVECTTFTDNRGISFEQAVDVGKKNMDKTVYIIDIAAARAEGKYPVYTYTDKPICDVIPQNHVDMDLLPEQLDKKERLKKQAMDISIRNRLITGKKDTNELTFSFNSKKFFDSEYDEESLFLDVKNTVLRGGLSEDKMEGKLRKLRLNNREVQRETGKGNLYLAINEMRWVSEDGKKYSAVLYICPADIFINRRGEYLFRVDVENVRFNPVLKEMLKQEQNIDISDMLDNPHRNEYSVQMDLLRYRIEKKADFEVVENQARLAPFNIPNEAIWQGISDDNVLSHEIVSSIMKNSMSWQDSVQGENEEDTVYAFQSDSSQSAIVKSAFDKKAQVVIGPAGNGKTQTIANLVTNAMEQGRKVLFVSEKKSALDIVKDMMETAGVSKFCLEVIEGVHNSADVSSQIEKTLHHLELGGNAERESNGEVRRYRDAGSKIRKYYGMMTQKGQCGKSLEELYRLYENYRECTYDLKLPSTIVSVNVDEVEDVINMYEQMIKMGEEPNGRLVKYLCFHDDNPDKKRQSEEVVLECVQEGEELFKCVKNLDSALGLSKRSNDKDWVTKGVVLASLICKCPVLSEDECSTLENETNGKALSDEEDDIKKEMLLMLDALKKAKRPSFLYDGIRRKLQEKMSPYVSFNESRVMLKGNNFDEIKEFILNLNVSEEGIGSSRYKNKKVYLMIKDELKNLDCSDDEKERIDSVINEIIRGKKTNIKDMSRRLVDVYKSYSAKQQVAEEMVVQDIEGFKKECPDVLRLALFTEWNRLKYKSQTMTNSINIRKRASSLGLDGLIDQLQVAVSEGRLNSEDMVMAFKKAWCKVQIEAIQDEFPELREFNHIEYQVSVRNYINGEKNIREDIRQNLIKSQMERLPNIQEGSTNTPELGKLYKLIRKKGKKSAIRTFFEQAPHIMSEIYPCMIMNPTAVAEYLPLDFPKFDMVIIDEGSQMPTYKAILPIFHGERCMIFGDEQQLAPTSFFQKGFEDEDGDVLPVESILDDAIATALPRKMLRYHYRSENESLIAFSNKRYYDGEVITFPSANTAVEGVYYEYVEEGCYDVGKSKTNEREALRVISKVKEIYANLPADTKETVGIITMNINQKNLIQSLLVNVAMEDDTLGRITDDLISVVNLEACQGKEWDNVIISPGFGPDVNGKFSLNLGAISRDGGSNRLNVLITRARKSMYVVTSIKPAMLSLANAQGTRDFRDFLAYANGDIKYDTRNIVNTGSKASLSEYIAEELRKKGCVVHTNIGSSDCKVDIGIVSPNNENQYVLGILLDKFKEAQGAIRDREVIYPEALQRKGWNIYRLHSINWYGNPEAEVQKILAMVKKAEGGMQ